MDRIAQIVSKSGFSLAALRDIYLLEVAPVVAPNLLTVAGVWTGFDERWLCAAIIDNLRRRPRYLRFLARFPLTRRMMTYATEDHWTKLVERVERLRAQSSSVGNEPLSPT